jgi:drug/metabolite transporter (DMT)-like permease
MSTLFLSIVSVFIWGTTWFAIKYQLGVVDPLWSVAIRFILAAAILFVVCRVRGLSWKVKDHAGLIFLGLLLFGFNYWLSYLSEIYVTSGLTAVVFSAMVFMNVFNAFLFLHLKINRRVIIGGLLGITGIILIYRPELMHTTGQNIFLGTVFAFVAAYSASLGNIVAVKIKTKGLHVFQSNAWAMFYGGLAMALLSLLLRRPLSFDFSFPYLASLSYLVVFGSVIAFSAYLTLASRIGPDKAAYVTMFIPVVALIVSALFEGYRFTPDAIIGIGLLIGGNFLALRKK